MNSLVCTSKEGDDVLIYYVEFYIWLEENSVSGPHEYQYKLGEQGTARCRRLYIE